MHLIPSNDENRKDLFYNSYEFLIQSQTAMLAFIQRNSTIQLKIREKERVSDGGDSSFSSISIEEHSKCFYVDFSV